MDFNIGKGVYIWQPASIQGGDPDKIVARLQLAGVQSAALKLCDAVRVFDDLEPLIRALRKANIRVAGWGYSYLTHSPREEAQAVVNACRRYEPDFYMIDVEAEVERNYGGARMFVNALRSQLPDLALGLNSFWNVKAHPDFPWAVFLDVVDFVCPQVYWRGTDPVGKLTQSQQGYANLPLARQVPMPLVAGDIYTHLGVMPTPDQVTQFLTAADTDPFIQGVFMWAADDTQTTPDLWQAFSKYQWKDGGVPLPTQPIGWAQVKAKAGLYVRSAPLGLKIGGLGKDDMTPIWALSTTQWAAITQNEDRWIFAGNPNYLHLTLDVPKPPVPPPGLYQAKVVPAAGLNIRDAANGNKVGVVPGGTIVQVYEEKDSFARIDPANSKWVSSRYLSRLN